MPSKKKVKLPPHNGRGDATVPEKSTNEIVSDQDPIESDISNVEVNSDPVESDPPEKSRDCLTLPKLNSSHENSLVQRDSVGQSPKATHHQTQSSPVTPSSAMKKPNLSTIAPSCSEGSLESLLTEKELHSELDSLVSSLSFSPPRDPFSPLSSMSMPSSHQHTRTPSPEQITYEAEELGVFYFEQALRRYEPQKTGPSPQEIKERIDSATESLRREFHRSNSTVSNSNSSTMDGFDPERAGEQLAMLSETFMAQNQPIIVEFINQVLNSFGSVTHTVDDIQVLLDDIAGEMIETHNGISLMAIVAISSLAFNLIVEWIAKNMRDMTKFVTVFVKWFFKFLKRPDIVQWVQSQGGWVRILFDACSPMVTWPVVIAGASAVALTAITVYLVWSRRQ